jgi:uncharacterized membrane protein
MKDLNMLIWLSQLGLSTALPPAVFCVLGIWLHRGRGWGKWTVWVGLILGLICAVQSFRHSLKVMTRMAEADSRELPGSFNEHK